MLPDFNTSWTYTCSNLYRASWKQFNNYTKLCIKLQKCIIQPGLQNCLERIDQSDYISVCSEDTYHSNTYVQ